jgi:hypothetical protein
VTILTERVSDRYSPGHTRRPHLDDFFDATMDTYVAALEGGFADDVYVETDDGEVVVGGADEPDDVSVEQAPGVDEPPSLYLEWV